MGVTRRQRLQEEFKRETSDILQKMKDPRIGFVSVTDAEISQDLRHVKIFVSVFGSEEARSARWRPWSTRAALSAQS